MTTRDDIREAALRAGQDPAIVDAIVRNLPRAMWWASTDGTRSGMVMEVEVRRPPRTNWPHFRATSLWTVAG